MKDFSRNTHTKTRQRLHRMKRFVWANGWTTVKDLMIAFDLKYNNAIKMAHRLIDHYDLESDKEGGELRFRIREENL